MEDFERLVTWLKTPLYYGRTLEESKSRAAVEFSFTEDVFFFAWTAAKILLVAETT